MGTEGISNSSVSLIDPKLLKQGKGAEIGKMIVEQGKTPDGMAFVLKQTMGSKKLQDFFGSLDNQAMKLYPDSPEMRTKYAQGVLNPTGAKTYEEGIDGLDKLDGKTGDITFDDLSKAIDMSRDKINNSNAKEIENPFAQPQTETQQSVETKAQVEQKPAEVPQAAQNITGTVVNEDIGTALDAGQRILKGESSPKDEAAKLLKKAQEEANSGNIETSKMYRAAGQTFNVIGQTSMNIAPDKRQQFINDCLDVDQPKGKKRGYTPEFNIDDIKKMQGDDNIMNYEDMGKIIFTNAEKYGATVAGKKIMKMNLDENPYFQRIRTTTARDEASSIVPEDMLK